MLLKRKCNVVIHSLSKKVTCNDNDVTSNALFANPVYMYMYMVYIKSFTYAYSTQFQETYSKRRSKNFHIF